MSEQTSLDTVHCANCAVDTPYELTEHQSGECPDCKQPWSGSEQRSTTISVTMPEQMSGGTQ